MCLCAFLYFNKLSTVNINYFCNQKKKSTTLLEGKKKSFPFNFSNLSVAERYLPSRPQIGEGEGIPLSLSLCLMLVTASSKLQVPNKYKSILETSRSVSMATWQGHDTIWVLPQHGDGPVGRTPDLMARGGQRAIVLICVAKASGFLRLKGTDISPNNGTLEVWTDHPDCGFPELPFLFIQLQTDVMIQYFPELHLGTKCPSSLLTSCTISSYCFIITHLSAQGQSLIFAGLGTRG